MSLIPYPFLEFTRKIIIFDDIKGKAQIQKHHWRPLPSSTIVFLVVESIDGLIYIQLSQCDVTLPIIR